MHALTLNLELWVLQRNKGARIFYSHTLESQGNAQVTKTQPLRSSLLMSLAYRLKVPGSWVGFGATAEWTWRN